LSTKTDRAQAKAGINRELQTKVRELTKEAAEIDDKIREVETKATRETDESLVVSLLDERAKLQKRKEALPFILRGTQVRALLRQSEALFEEAAELKVELDAAEVEVEAASAKIPDLERQLQEAKSALETATQRRDQLSLHHASLTKGAGYARADAGCIERGEEPKFEPGRFIGF